MQNKLVVFDFETDGTDPNTCEILEFGWVLWDFARDQILKMRGDLVPYDKPVTPEALTALRVNKIDISDTLLYGISLKAQVLDFRLSLLEHKNSIAGHLAHNGLSFDHIILDRLLKEFALENEFLGSRLDTLIHVPLEKRGKSLEVLAARMKHPMANPFPHRALTDCLTLTRVAHDIGVENIISYSRLSEFTLTPDPKTTKAPWEDGGAYNKKLKQFGLRWNPEKKIWFKLALGECEAFSIRSDAGQNYGIELIDERSL